MKSSEKLHIRPVSNVVLLRCQTQMNLIRKLHGNGKGLVLKDEFNSVAPNSK